MSAVSPLTHRLEGEGEPLLLLNGGMMTFAAWEPVAAPLRPRFRLVLCDFRGQLRTPGEAHRELAGNVTDLAALLDHLEIERAHLLGASFGAEVGLLMAARLPARVRSLIAVTATDVASPAMRRGVAELREVTAQVLAGGEAGLFYDALVPEIYSPAYRRAHAEELALRRGQAAATPREWYQGLEGILAATESLDLRPWLGEIRCPTLVVAAGDDRVMPPERSRALAAAIPSARLVEHATSGHALVVEEPEWLARQCLAFLTGIGAGAAAES